MTQPDSPSFPKEFPGQGVVSWGYDMYRADTADDDDAPRTDGEYFRLNIGGMRVARDELRPVGVMVDDGEGRPPYAEFGYTTWPAETDTSPEAVALHEAWRQLVEEARPGDVFGIPTYKVGSNDWWWVRSGEITTGLAYADRFHHGWRERLSDFVAEFVQWMESCVPHGGFRVG